MPEMLGCQKRKVVFDNGDLAGSCDIEQQRTGCGCGLGILALLGFFHEV